jgi:hypothetical protein
MTLAENKMLIVHQFGFPHHIVNYTVTASVQTPSVLQLCTTLAATVLQPLLLLYEMDERYYC